MAVIGLYGDFFNESFTLHQFEDPFRLLARPPGNYRLHFGAGQRIYLMHRGYIKIWRKIKDCGLFQLPNALTLFIYMLTEATHKPIRYGTVELERGQIVTGRHKLAAELEMSEQTIRTSLEHLIKLEFITSKPTNKYTVYTIVNYNKYQDIDSIPNQQNNQQLTNEQPTTNQQLTTIQTHKHINTKENNSCAPNGDANKNIYSKAFEMFYEMYPRKKSKGDAAKAFKKIKPEEYPFIKEGLIKAKDSEDWKKNNGEFIPYPASWLNSRGWEDEYTKTTTKKAWE